MRAFHSPARRLQLFEERREVIFVTSWPMYRGLRNRRNEADPLAASEVGGEPLEHGVCMGRKPDFQWPVRPLFADAVEDDDAAGASQRDKARELVDQLSRVGEGAGVEEVVAVEQVEGRVSHLM
jgi:hypothetical protein